MTAIEIERALIDIVLEKDKECRSLLSSLDKKEYTQRKALLTESGMYNLCLMGGLVYTRPDKRMEILQAKSARFPNFAHDFPALRNHYLSLGADDQIMMTAALYGEIWIIDQILRPKQEELLKAMRTGDIERKVELALKINVLKSVLVSWKNWREYHSIFPEWPGATAV